MTATAGDGNVGAIDGRVGIVAGDDCVDVTVAVLTGGGDFSGGGDLGVNAVRVALALVGVALVAGDLFRGGFVRDGFYVGVAIDAGK